MSKKKVIRNILSILILLIILPIIIYTTKDYFNNMPPENPDYEEKREYVLTHSSDVDRDLNIGIDFDYDFTTLNWLSGECKGERKQFCESYTIYPTGSGAAIDMYGGGRIGIELLDTKYSEEMDAKSAGTNQVIEDIDRMYNSILEKRYSSDFIKFLDDIYYKYN